MPEFALSESVPMEKNDGTNFYRMSPAKAKALREFEESARAAHQTQLAAQVAAKRYAAAMQRLSEVCSADETPLSGPETE